MSTGLSTSLAARVARDAAAAGLLEPGLRVLVAASGGGDSTALALLLHAASVHGLPLSLVLGHVDHGWRGPEEGAADRAAVEALGRRLDVPVCVSPPAPAAIPHTEDAARRWRYRQLSTMAHERACSHVATGHHAGDQAETILMRLLRGAGLVGLTGIPARRTLEPGGLTVVRPLLAVEPEELRAHLQEAGVSWREDPTNRDLTRDRARIRARLAGRGGQGRTHRRTLVDLSRRLGRRLRRREARIQEEAQCFRLHRLAAAVAMPRAFLQGLRGVDLALALRAAGRLLHADADGPWFTRRHAARFEWLLEDGGALDLPRGLFVHVGGKTVWLARRSMPLPELPALHLTEVDREAFDLEAFLARDAHEAAALDASRLGTSPALRLLTKGDRFTPYGTCLREVEITRWLSRHGVPALCRRGELVLEGAGGIAWLAGRRVDQAHIVGPETTRVAVVELRWPKERN